ncbi:hypothetical protein JXB28_06020 [Candidatus Woesearchaeota archaeon]|nr:hypothetical protein [Candidatus Woesearchaeota archaeon]
MEEMKMEQTKKPEYLISKGIVELLQNRYGLNLSEKARTNIMVLENEFVDTLEREISDVYDYKTISAKTIENTVAEQLKQNNLNDLPLICLDDVYFKGFKIDGTISATRLLEDINDFNKKAIGPRKGFPSLEQQLDLLEQDYAGKEVALIDVGVFEGETLLKEIYDKETKKLISKEGIIPDLKKRGIRVKELYVGIMNEPVIEKFQREGVKVIPGNRYDFNDGDWLEVRDLLGLDGRKINPDSHNIINGTHLFARYIHDPKTLKDGASIADGVTAAIVLDLCNMYQKKIMREIRKDGYQIIEGFINSDPRLYTLDFKKNDKELAQ